MNICLELNYNTLIDKAKREIERLRNAENELDPLATLDHALNAAFTIYHLLEWRQNPTSISEEELKRLSKKKVRISSRLIIYVKKLIRLK